MKKICIGLALLFSASSYAGNSNDTNQIVIREKFEAGVAPSLESLKIGQEFMCFSYAAEDTPWGAQSSDHTLKFLKIENDIVRVSSRGLFQGMLFKLNDDFMESTFFPNESAMEIRFKVTGEASLVYEYTNISEGKTFWRGICILSKP